jgi:uncharacterized protein YjiS (DUF1127 family)
MSTPTSIIVAPRLPAAPSPWPRVASLGRVWALLTEWLDRAHAQRRLAELDDHLLKDIGLTRDDVARLDADLFWPR